MFGQFQVMCQEIVFVVLFGWIKDGDGVGNVGEFFQYVIGSFFVVFVFDFVVFGIWCFRGDVNCFQFCGIYCIEVVGDVYCQYWNIY